MGSVQQIQAKIAKLQAELAVLLSYPEDTFPFGTVALITSEQNTKKSYYTKIGEESWKRLTISSDQHSRELSEWISKYADETDEYFEVFIMQPGANPIYTRPE